VSTCPVCNTHGLHPFIVFDDVPVSGLFGDGPESQVPHRRLAFDYCPCCCLVTQQPEPERTIDYTGVARATARQLPAYAEVMIEHLHAAGPGARLIEVGCNDGTFLNALRSAGFTRLLGVEPSQALAAQVAAQGHAVVQKPLDLELAAELVANEGPADTVVCRHTLEHVPAPLEFLQALRHLLRPRGLVCIEVPSLLPVIESLHIHEVWDEHISYFLPENLAYALNKSGFSIETISIEPYREMQNIVVWARAIDIPDEMPSVPLLPRSLALCASFSDRWQACRRQLFTLIEGSMRPRVALGASHPQANFLNFSGLSALIDALIDDDPAKRQCWLPLCGGSVPIHPSSELPLLLAGGTLLLTGFGYPAWMSKASQVAQSLNVDCIDIPALISQVHVQTGNLHEHS